MFTYLVKMYSEDLPVREPAVMSSNLPFIFLFRNRIRAYSINTLTGALV